MGKTRTDSQGNVTIGWDHAPPAENKLVPFVEGNYETGVIVPKQEMNEINKRLIRSETLPSYDILVLPKRPRGR